MFDDELNVRQIVDLQFEQEQSNILTELVSHDDELVLAQVVHSCLEHFKLVWDLYLEVILWVDDQSLRRRCHEKHCLFCVGAKQYWVLVKRLSELVDHLCLVRLVIVAKNHVIPREYDLIFIAVFRTKTNNEFPADVLEHGVVNQSLPTQQLKFKAVLFARVSLFENKHLVDSDFVSHEIASSCDDNSAVLITLT